MISQSVAVPRSVRVAMAHATVQALAEDLGADVLHIKGPALDPSLRWPGRESSDADVLVRPSHLDAFLAALPSHGFDQMHSFRTSSAFEHSATFRHRQLGDVDVHRYIPGIGLSADAAFEELWSGREARSIASVPCPVPSLTAQILVLALHAARSGGTPRSQSDIRASWLEVSQDQRHAVLRLVSNLDAQVAFSVIQGDLDRFRGERAYRLWKIVSSGGTRFEEWAARVWAARSPWVALRIALQAPLVNVDHLRVLLGRRPTRREIVREFFARPLRGAAEQRRARRLGTRKGTR